MEKYRATTEKRLDIVINVCGEEFIKLGQKLGLATHPFEKRLRFFRRNRLNSSNGKLLVAYSSTAWGLGNVRTKDFIQRILWIRDFPMDFVSVWFWIRSLI